MFAWLTTPLMLGLGALAVASPIIIHLLNKRHFKIVDWAAMDFLFEAEKKNRRRVRIENFILLALRCLAMLLIGLALARPFLPSGIASVMQQEKQYERLILLDDSLSCRVLKDGQPSMEIAKDSLKRLVSELAESDTTEDWLTLMLTSQTGQPVLANEPVTRNTLPSLNDAIDAIECSEKAADYSKSFTELRRYVGAQKENMGRVVYVFSDMRIRDWISTIDSQSESAPDKLLNQIAKDAADTFLIDVGGDKDQNLAITALRPLDLQIADKVVRFSAEVTNFGTTTASDVRVIMQIDDSPPQYQIIASLPANETQEVVFPFLFESQQVRAAGTTTDPQSTPKFRNYRVTAEIDRQSFSTEELKLDQLIEDSSAAYAARILDGIPVLLIDGDPLAVSERSETHYLKSLDVLGTGLNMDVATVMEFESVSLSNYRVIFLCNIDEASPDRIKSLAQWIEDGGSLVFMPGNKVRAARFNDSFYQQGNGLSPVGLDTIAGDPTMSSWVNFEIDPQLHPSLRVIVDSDATSLSRVDVFSWWTSTLNENEIGKTIVVPLRLSDEKNSPAMVERSLGNGKIVTFTIPGDGDWTMWPSSPTFAPVMIDLIDYLVGSIGENTNVEVGGSVSYSVDLSNYDSRVSLRDPSGEKIEAVARPIDDSAEGKENVMYRVQFDDISRRGFYEIGLKRHSGETETVLLASNIDPSEGKLRRLAATATQGDFFSDRIRRVSVDGLENKEISGGNTEVWPQILILLIGILAVEQLLAWWFGKRR